MDAVTVAPPERPTGREEAFERFSRAVDGPLMILALAMIPLLVLPLVVNLSPATERAFLAADYLIWAIFAVEYAVKLYLAPNRRRFVRRNIPDLILVVVPMLRPLRVLRSARLLRLLRLTRVVAVAVRGLSDARSILRKRGLNYVLLVAVAVVLIASALVRVFERGVEDANISSFPDALWWAATTVTTVGYGDRFPVSAGARGIAVALMIVGIALLGVITATIAAYFVEQEEKTDDAEVVRRLDEIAARLDQIEERIASK